MSAILFAMVADRFSSPSTIAPALGRLRAAPADANGAHFLHRVYALAPSLYKVFRPFSLTFSPTKTNLNEGVNGHCIYRGDRRLCSAHRRLCVRLRCPGRGQAMNLFYFIGAIAAAGLLVYLVVALLKAENL